MWGGGEERNDDKRRTRRLPGTPGEGPIFAEHRDADLQSRGVHCWFAPHDLQIVEEIRPASLRRQRHIGDFTGWKDHDAYQRAFTRRLARPESGQHSG